MADEEADWDRSPEKRLGEDVLELRGRLQKLEEVVVGPSSEGPAECSAVYCQEFCRTLVEYAGRWSIEEDPLPLVEVYIVALLSYAQASSYLSLQCENVPLVVERLSLSFVELLLSLKKNVPEALWKQFKLSVQFSSTKLQENGISQLSTLVGLCQYDGVWNSQVLRGLLSREELQTAQVEKFLMQEGPVLLEMRVKQLMKDNHAEKAAALAEACSRCPAFQEKSSFKQLFLVCLCATSERDQLMEELSKEDCRDALEMICNLESDGDDKAAFSLCTAFLTRQLLQGDTYCAWELTLFWSKLLKRLEPSEQEFLDRCRQMSLLSKTVYHILFLIKVVQSEIDNTGLPVCIEMCVRALRMESDDGNTKASVCKTISCLLPTDLEVKRACQLTEFLLEPTVDAYYAVETLYNEPDQKVEEEEMPISNSLRCELLLVLKTNWPFDPEFWDWRTLKRQCLALMGEEASIVSSIDLLNDNEEPQREEHSFSQDYFNNTSVNFMSGTCSAKLTDMERRQKNRELKKLREKGFISAKFRNWQAYMQYCVLCDKEFLGHRIVRHAQIHFCNGVYRCPICAQSFSSKDIFLPHVKSHVKQSCKERLTALKSSKQLPSPEVSIPDTAALKAKTEKDFKQKFSSQMINGILMPHVEIRLSRCDMETTDTYMCPVGKCRRNFKFLKNLVAHVKSHGNNEEAKTFLEMRSKKVVCQYCRRRFVTATHLNDHLQVHRGTKPYICIQLNCKASFQSNSELHEHKRIHPVFRAKCTFPNCGKIFSQAYKLYDHEEFHYKRFTCKFVDCGRVFQSLKQLDLHQEKHTSIKKESTFGATPQNMQPASLIKQMLTSPSQPGSSQGKPNSESGAHQSEQLPVTAEGSHKPDTPADPQMVSLQTSLSQNLMNSVIQPVNPNLSDSNRYRGGLDGHSPTSNISNAQMLNRNDQQEPVCSSRLSSVSPLYTPMGPGSQPLAPVKPEKTLTITSGADPPAGQKKRYHCAFENCKRLYCAHRSVTKHMRAVHPDFYEQWKHIRTPIKVTYVLVPELPLARYDCSGDQQNSRLPVGVPRQNIIQSPPSTSTTSQSYTPVHSESSPSHNASVILENGLPPNGISQLGSQNGPKWRSASANEQIQQVSSNICPSDMQGIPQGDCMSTAPLLNTPSLSMMAATRPPETVQAPPLGSSSHSVLPYMTGAKQSSQHLHTSQMQSSTTSSSDGMQTMQKHREGNIPTPHSASQNNVPGLCMTDSNGHKQTKRHRSKWPAIVRDGKFVCCLCFKEFSNPKSLGGHLSRGAACRPDKTDLNSELPKSFLDFLHSDQTIPSQPSLRLSQNPVFPQSVINGSTSTNLNFPPENLPGYGNGDTGVIKQTCTETSMPDYYNQTSNPVPCAPRNAAERSAGTSVIQRTETLQANHQGPSFPAIRYFQPSVKTYEGSQLPNPAHPHILSGTPPVSPVSTKQREQYHLEGQNSETTVEKKDTNLNSASGCGRAETQRKMLEQDVKRRLREQILGDELKRAKADKNTDTNNSFNNPTSFGSLHNPLRNYEVEQALSDKNSTSVVPETPAETKYPMNTLSFTGFRESSAIQSEALSPEVVTAQDADLEPSESSGSQQQCITEIQSAFEKLDLVTEVSAQISLPVKPNPNTVIHQPVTNNKVLFPAHLKPFACDNESCTVRFMTGDALWKHLSKIHSYTVEMVNQAKKRYGQYAPFKCQKCHKCFTRNTSLRIHYQSTHKLSTKEIEDLDLRRRHAAALTLKAGATANDKHQGEGQWAPFQHLQPAGPRSQANGCPLNDQGSSTEIPKKTKARKPSDYSNSPFRPYRCFHQGCEAAFTIQHNLILHYRVVHQSALSALAVSKDPADNNGLQVKSQDEDNPEEQVFKMSEFRCQVKDCSRVFQEVPNLVQHYLRLHRFGVDNIGVLLSSIKPQTFICGYQGCPAIFTTACRYVGHVREQHNDMLAQPEQFNGSFRCEFEGCDRTYATKSNMVRHFMMKHGKLYRAKLKKEQIKRAKMKRSSGALRYQITKTLNGKENIDRKIWKKGDLKRKKRSKANIWTTYGKPSLKTKGEASALCTKKFPLQYPCMIKGCESVMNSERNILKHYLGHGLSEKFLELQRSHFIFCKKAPRLKWSSLRSDESKSDSELSSGELNSETSPDEDDSGGSKPALRRRTSTKVPIVLFDSKLANVEGFSRSIVVKRKRGRPRKFPERGKRKKIPHTKLDLDCSGEEESDFSPPAVMQEEVKKLSTPLATFKPMGFEMSFLKFLEQSNKSDPLAGKAGEAERLRKQSLQSREDICIRFKNHKKLKSLSKVKIVIDGAFSGVTKLMLTQLQDMHPTVVLRGK